MGVLVESVWAGIVRNQPQVAFPDMESVFRRQFLTESGLRITLAKA